MAKDGHVIYSVVMGGEETEVNGKWAQGDFVDTLALLQLTDNFKPDASNNSAVIIAAAVAVTLAIVLILLKRRK